jgi:ATP-dependent RNA helicase DDX51/DBP6
VGVSVALAIGQTDFEAEQEAMLRREGGKEGWVDVVVATPGRLMDHMDRTKGFTLEHLRYLVLDEVDRLVNQSYQEWAQRVHDAAYAQRQGTFSFLPSSSSREEGVEQEDGEEEEEGSTCTSYKIHPTSLRLRPTHHIPLSSSTSTSLHPFLQPPIPLRKLLFSATFTSNPQKLARLNLRNPRYFSIDGHVIDPPPNPKEGEERDEENLQEGEGEEGEAVSGTPATLKEEVVVCSGKDKPLVLLALLLRELQAFSSLPPSRSPSPPPLILIFTSSLDSTHRLCRLLQLCAATVQVPENSFALPPSLAPSLPPSHPALSSSVVCEFSSSLSQPQRAALLQRCLTTGREGGVRVLVASDGMARGIDLPNVSAVVNYDCPRQAKTYIHRVGRTARAGREGRSVTLLKQGQEKEFERLRKGVGDGGKWKGVGRLGVGRWGGLEMLMPGYKKALRGLRDVMGREKGGRLKATEGMSEGVVREVLRLGGAGGSGGGKEEEEEEEEEEEDDEEGEEEEEEEEDD